MTSHRALKGAALALLLVGAYVPAALIGNNAAFTNAPGALQRLGVYCSMNRAWTTGGYPLPELSSRTFYGVEPKLRTNVLGAVNSLSGWSVERSGPEGIRVRVGPSLWHGSSILELSMASVPEGLRVNAVSRSLSLPIDLGANRNFILTLYHAIGEENALHPPV